MPLEEIIKSGVEKVDFFQVIRAFTHIEAQLMAHRVKNLASKRREMLNFQKVVYKPN